MRGSLYALGLACLTLIAADSTFAGECIDDPVRSGIARTIAIDSTNGPSFGRLQYPNTVSLKRGEVVLTFDDGPLGRHTLSILDILDKHCARATFFTVGRMAWHNASVLKHIARRGHTIGTHTWSHPRALNRLPLEEAKLEIEKGFAAVSYTLGGPIAPFFRYPGLNHSQDLNAYLSSRNISVWSVDVVSGDTVIDVTAEDLVDSTIHQIKRMGRGIVLFHDIKPVTGEALDAFLTQLKDEGFRIVHVVSNTAYKPDPEMVAQMDFTKRPLHSVALTGTGPRDDGDGAGDDVLAEAVKKGTVVDIMKTEWIHIESSGNKPGDGQERAGAAIETGSIVQR